MFDLSAVSGAKTVSQSVIRLERPTPIHSASRVAFGQGIPERGEQLFMVSESKRYERTLAKLAYLMDEFNAAEERRRELARRDMELKIASMRALSESRELLARVDDQKPLWLRCRLG
jgi:hypothetical protein